jgi:hypothetical protein
VPKLITIFWRDIPAQVIGRVGRNTFKRALHPRFQAAIDRAAMRAGRGSSEAYLDDWRRQTELVDGDIETLVEARVVALESAFSDEQLEKAVKAGGRRPASAGSADD